MLRTYIKWFSVLSVIIIFSISAVEEKTIRAAFDLGSGDFKLCVAKVENGSHEILFQRVITVNLGADYNQNQGTLSQAVQERALKALKDLRADAEKFGATNYLGIATAVFRKATNGPELLDSLVLQCNIPLKILSQEDEGKLGFLTGKAIFPQIPEEELVLIDMGSLSIQITGNGENESYGANIGNSTVERLFAEKIRNQKYSKGTLHEKISFEEVIQLSELAMEYFPGSDWLQNRKLSGKARLAYFDYTVMINTIDQLTGKNDKLEINELEKALQNLTNPDFNLNGVSADRRQYRLFNLTLVYALIKKLGFEEINLGINDVGNSPGLALADEFWK